jgi:O-antigen ligase
MLCKYAIKYIDTMTVVIIIILICVLWSWAFLWNHPNFEKVRYSDIEPHCKSGDLILFHGLDSTNAMYMASYYTHIGIVYRESQDARPVLFEAWNSSAEILYPEEVAHGIAISDLENRVNSYRGYIFYKPLAQAITPEQQERLLAFMNWAYANMHYNPRVIKNGAKKLLLNEQLHTGTNCGEIVYLALIAMGLLSESRIYENRKHHLRWVCALELTDNGNKYLPMAYIWQSYFKLPASVSSK